MFESDMHSHRNCISVLPSPSGSRLENSRGEHISKPLDASSAFTPLSSALSRFQKLSHFAIMAEAEMQAAVDAIIKDPAGSVKKAMTSEGREFYALSALTITVQTPALWSQLRDAGVLNVFVELLVDEWTSPQVENVRISLTHWKACIWTNELSAPISTQTAPGWVFSLTGIINVLVSLKKDERIGDGKDANASQYEIIRKAYPRIEATLWKVHEAANSDKLVDVLALGMFHLARVPDLHPCVNFYSNDSAMHALTMPKTHLII